MGCDYKFHIFFQSYHHWKINWITIIMFYGYCCHSSKSSLPFNFWLICENFYFRLKKNTLFSTHLMILRNFCFLFLNWQQTVNVSHDSQHVAIHKLKCQCIKLPGLGSIQFRNWNCSSIPIPIPELELKLVELKMELELKYLELELELKTGIEFFATATAALTS